MVYFFNLIWWFSFPEIYPVSGFFLDFSGVIQILGFLWFFSYVFRELMVYFSNMICFTGNSSGFRIFYRIYFNSHISMLHFIYFQRIDNILFKYDMFDRKFIRFLDFSPDFFKFSDFHNSFHTGWAKIIETRFLR